MGIFDRMSRVLSSNFNALLDKLEDPKKSVDLLLDQMREQIRLGRQHVVQSVAAEKQLKQKVADLDQQIERWNGRAELAVRRGDDALAREALVQKRRLVGERDRAEALRAEQRANALEVKAEIERMESKLTELTAKKGTLVAQVQQARAGGGAEGLGAGAARPFDDFRRMEDQIEGVEAAIQAQREVDEALAGGRGVSGMTPDEVEAKFRALEAGTPLSGSTPAVPNEVDEELSALKKRVRVET